MLQESVLVRNVVVEPCGKLSEPTCEIASKLICPHHQGALKSFILQQNIVWNAPAKREEINNHNLFSKHSLRNAPLKVEESCS